ncbi:MAG: SUMF1/EgtB/PvdO family nonheme iron enzyme [Bacteroidota bacterium]
MKNLLYVTAVVILFSACKGGLPFVKKKMETSSVTGWNYNDRKMGGFYTSPVQEQSTGPGLVFVQGGTYTMGAADEDVMGDWNNVPRRVTVSSFYIDKSEVANIHYREYLHWIERTFDDPMYENVINGAKPDTLVWRSELAANEPLVEYYFRHPSYNNYPVVGVSWRQANDFCIWRGNRVNELILVQRGLANRNQLKNMQGQAEENFTTKSYLLGLYAPQAARQKRPTLFDENGRPRNYVKVEDGILLPEYRLPTEAEWEYAAYGYINQNPNVKRREGKRGEELIMNKQVYSWSHNINGMRDNRYGGWQGKYMANFKRGTGDYMGIAGGLNDNSAIPGPVEAFYPNGFGLYNMSGNVNEWVSDVYRPMSSRDVDDFNPYRGNVFTRPDKDANGEYQRDSLGRVKTTKVSDEESRSRRNYQSGYAVNYQDGDSLSMVSYNYGSSTLISDKSRVIKGGSWDDRAYWLSPGTRRHMEEDQASSTIGFRCAMDRFGSQEGNGFRNGMHFSARRQNARKQ